MWSAGDSVVTCIACGESIPREDAREYDKYGDRWDRQNKTFEYLCKPCDRTQCRQPRGDLEELLTEIGAGHCDQAEFLSWYVGVVSDRYGELEEP